MLLTLDARLRYNVLERAAIMEHGVAVFVLVGGRSHDEKAEAFSKRAVGSSDSSANTNRRPVDLDPLAVAQRRGHAVDPRDARLAVLAGDHGSVLEHAADLEHDRSGVDEERGPAGIGGVGAMRTSPSATGFSRGWWSTFTGPLTEPGETAMPTSSPGFAARRGGRRMRPHESITRGSSRMALATDLRDLGAGPAGDRNELLVLAAHR